MNTQDVIIAGATGLIGQNLLSIVTDSNKYNKVHVLARRKISPQHNKVIVHQSEFGRLEETLTGISVSTVFCCLGTTMRNAGSADAFRKVDFDYPLHLAKIMHGQGAKQFALVSSTGANKNSRIFYSRVKGEIETAIADLDFKSILIFRPSLLLGSRPEFRFGESVSKIFMQVFSPLFIGSLKRYRPVQARSVGAVMAHEAAKDLTGVNIYESDQIQIISNKIE